MWSKAIKFAKSVEIQIADIDTFNSKYWLLPKARGNIIKHNKKKEMVNQALFDKRLSLKSFFKIM